MHSHVDSDLWQPLVVFKRACTDIHVHVQLWLEDNLNWKLANKQVYRCMHSINPLIHDNTRYCTTRQLVNNRVQSVPCSLRWSPCTHAIHARYILKAKTSSIRRWVKLFSIQYYWRTHTCTLNITRTAYKPCMHKCMYWPVEVVHSDIFLLFDRVNAELASLKLLYITDRGCGLWCPPITTIFNVHTHRSTRPGT